MLRRPSAEQEPHRKPSGSTRNPVTGASIRAAQGCVRLPSQDCPARRRRRPRQMRPTHSFKLADQRSLNLYVLRVTHSAAHPPRNAPHRHDRSEVRRYGGLSGHAPEIPSLSRTPLVSPGAACNRSHQLSSQTRSLGMPRPWEVDPDAQFRRRLGKTAAELGASRTTND
jgi:hypothetical protein